MGPIPKTVVCNILLTGIVSILSGLSGRGNTSPRRDLKCQGVGGIPKGASTWSEEKGSGDGRIVRGSDQEVSSKQDVK